MNLELSTRDPVSSMGPISMARLAEHLRDHDIVPRNFYDIGACSGAYTWAFLQEFPDTPAVLIEGLVENVARWIVPELPANCVALSAVLDRHPLRRPYYVQELNGLHSLYNRTSLAGVPRTVQTTTLDRLCVCFDLPRPDVVKIDVEGAALDVILGGMVQLVDARAIHLETETVEYFTGQSFDAEVTALLELGGFHCIERVAMAIGDGTQVESIWLRA